MSVFRRVYHAIIAAFLQPASELVVARVRRISRPFEAGAAAAQ